MKNNKVLTIWKRFCFDRKRRKAASLADVIYRKACNTEALNIYHQTIREAGK